MSCSEIISTINSLPSKIELRKLQHTNIIFTYKGKDTEPIDYWYILPDGIDYTVNYYSKVEISLSYASHNVKQFFKDSKHVKWVYP